MKTVSGQAAAAAAAAAVVEKVAGLQWCDQ